jgi:hypothetical protein
VEAEAVVGGGGGGDRDGKVRRVRIGVTLFRRPPQYILCLYL